MAFDDGQDWQPAISRGFQSKVGDFARSFLDTITGGLTKSDRTKVEERLFAMGITPATATPEQVAKAEAAIAADAAKAKKADPSVAAREAAMMQARNAREAQKEGFLPAMEAGAGMKANVPRMGTAYGNSFAPMQGMMDRMDLSGSGLPDPRMLMRQHMMDGVPATPPPTPYAPPRNPLREQMEQQLGRQAQEQQRRQVIRNGGFPLPRQQPNAVPAMSQRGMAASAESTAAKIAAQIEQRIGTPDERPGDREKLAELKRIVGNPFAFDAGGVDARKLF